VGLEIYIGPLCRYYGRSQGRAVLDTVTSLVLRRPVDAGLGPPPGEMPGDQEAESILATGSPLYEQVHRPELWLPVEFENVFQAEEAPGGRCKIGSVFALERQLREVNDATWKASGKDILRWSHEEPDGFEPLARWGYSIWFRLVEKAVAGRMPMRLDY
jgi:hypothetical protein